MATVRAVGWRDSRNQYISSEPSREERWSNLAQALIVEALEAGDRWGAQQAALQWSHGVSDRWGLAKTSVWKLFKRSLVSRWFGKYDSRVFLPGWSTQSVLEYALGIPGRPVRFSVFPEDIACHSRSLRFPPEDKSQWQEILGTVANSCTIEVFPESGTADDLCFRRYSREHRSDVRYEAGLGQATYVFEAEQGKHAIVSAVLDVETFRYSRQGGTGLEVESTDRIECLLKELIRRFEETLDAKTFSICRSIGTEWIAIEGYFGTKCSADVRVVDIDLPFDIAFMGQ